MAKYEGEKVAQLLNELATRFDCALAATRAACAERDALAAENSALKESVEHAAGCIHAAEAEGLIDALSETPATERFSRELQAQGVEAFAAELFHARYRQDFSKHFEDEALKFAQQLRGEKA